MNGCELYRHFAKDGRLLYIGISISTMARLQGHKCESSWFNEIAVVTIERFPDRKSALIAETEAIKRERPIHNVAKSENGSHTQLNGVIVNAKQVADVLGIDRKTLRKRVRQGVCPVVPLAGINPPVWHRAEVDAFVAGER